MGFWQRAAAVLRADTALRRRVPSATRGADEDASGEQLLALQEIAERMAGMATTIKQLEEQAKSLDEEAEDLAQSGDASGDSAIAERAHMQVEVIDEMLDGIRSLRAAIDQQRAELIDAEHRLSHEGQPAADGDATSG